MTAADELELIRQAYDIGERDGSHAGELTAGQLFNGPEANAAARQCLADLEDGSPDLWELMPDPTTDDDAWTIIHDNGHDLEATPPDVADRIADGYADGYGAGWITRMKRHAELQLAMFADFDTVTH